MMIAGVRFPIELLNALRNDTLVVFAGAGVSMAEPASLPNFSDLATAVGHGTGIERDPDEPLDRYLGRLFDKGVAVHGRAAERLSAGPPDATELHRALLKLFPGSDRLRIVTTNFDGLFETAGEGIYGSTPPVFTVPALPLGYEFRGIVNVHGSLGNPGSMVLTDRDFGRAYLTVGRTRLFLVELFSHFTVLFVGYSHDDIVMSYLARALPTEASPSRFALTDEETDSRWRFLGIEPIRYSNADATHSVLLDGIAGLGTLVHRRVLTWQQQIRSLAASTPEFLGEEDGDLVEDALTDVTRTRFFTSSAVDPEWVHWLDRRGLLDPLFEYRDLSPTDELLAHWLAKEFVAGDPDLLFRLIARKRTTLSRGLWVQLGREVADIKFKDLQPLSRWLSLLLSSTPRVDDSSLIPLVLTRLGERCIEDNFTRGAFQIFRALCALRLTPTIRGTYFEPTLTGEYWVLHKIWAKALYPALDSLANDLLDFVVHTLTQLQMEYVTWGRGTRNSNPLTIGRNAIELPNRPGNGESGDVLIEAALVTLAHLSVADPDLLGLWCERLAQSEHPIHRRLAVNALKGRKDLSQQATFEWLTTHIGLEDFAAHHEIFQAVKDIYAAADDDLRSKVLQAIADSTGWVTAAGTSIHTAYAFFNWLAWLGGSSPECTLVESARKEVLRAYPDFEPRERPDHSYYIISGGAMRAESPWLAQELLADIAANWLSALLDFEGDGILGPDREGMLREVSNAIQQEPKWGIDLANALVAEARWESDLWPALLKGWTADTNQVDREQILQFLENEHLCIAHVKDVSSFLLDLSRAEDNESWCDAMPRLNKVAEHVWELAWSYEDTYSSDDLLLASYNHPMGVMVSYWMHAMAIEINKCQKCPDEVTPYYLEFLSKSVASETEISDIGKVAIYRQLSFLANCVETWVCDHLLPLLRGACDPKATFAAWLGVIDIRAYSPRAMEVVKSSIMDLLPMLKMMPDDEEFRWRVVGLFALITVEGPPKPAADWFAALYSNLARDDDRVELVRHIGDILGGRDICEQTRVWTKVIGPFWENRLRGVPPPPLTDRETEAMVDWLPLLRGIYVEVAEMITNTEGAKLTSYLLLHRLKESDCWQEHADETAKVLIHLGKAALEKEYWKWHEAHQLLVQLRELVSEDATKVELKELEARLGILQDDGA